MNSNQTITNNRITFPQAAVNASQQSQKPPAPIRAFSSPPQKVNPNRRADQRSHKRINVTHSDRNRAAANNSNNVWCRAEQFFLPLPTNQEIDKMFSIRRIPELRELDGEVKHWSFRMTAPNCRANGKAMIPPGPPSSSDDIADFWLQNRPWFQIEKVQRSNCSPLHCLLNAFVDISPAEMRLARQQSSKETQENHLQNTETDTQKTEINTETETDQDTNIQTDLQNETLSNDQKMTIKRRRVFARSHPLLPFVDSDPYMCFPFDTRLGLELESLGLNQPQRSSSKDCPFQNEIVELRNRIANETIPAIDKYFEEIQANIDRYREDQQTRNEKIEEVDQQIAEINAKKRKRKE